MSDESASARPPLSKTRRWLVRTAVIFGVLGGLGLIVRGCPPSLENPSGDRALGRLVEAQDLHAHKLSVVYLDGNGAKTAHWNAGPDDLYELGSVSKALTGLVLADAQARGEISAESTVKELGLPGVQEPLASVTIEQLATHHSGLPRLPITLEVAKRAWLFRLFGKNPYNEDLPAMFEQAKGVPLDEKKFSYSNLGAALAGQLLAQRVGISFETLLQKRLFDPLNLQATKVQSTEALVEPGLSESGRTQEPWVFNAYAPAGGVVSTSEDMRRFLSALLSAQVPGIQALNPRAKVDAEGSKKVGYFWFSQPCPKRFGGEGSIVWHNGGTGGYASFVGINRGAGRGVALMSATESNLDPVGVQLLCEGLGS